MIKLDIEKYKTHKVEVVLRPNFGTSPPIKVKFVKRIYVDDEGVVTSIDYTHPKTYESHWAYGYQIDDIIYYWKRGFKIW